jgi:hypothetical protein
VPCGCRWWLFRDIRRRRLGSDVMVACTFECCCVGLDSMTSVF